MPEVDAFDLKMLAALQDDGRLTNQQLADLIGLSASQCSRRRMRLEEEKVIAGYHADLAGEALGFGLIAFIHITLATHSPDNAKRFRELVNRVDDIQEAYALTGDADYVLKVMLRDLKSLSDIVNNVLMPHQSVAHVRSSIVLDRIKESAKLPLAALPRTPRRACPAQRPYGQRGVGEVRICGRQRIERVQLRHECILTRERHVPCAVARGGHVGMQRGSDAPSQGIWQTVGLERPG